MQRKKKNLLLAYVLLFFFVFAFKLVLKIKREFLKTKNYIPKSYTIKSFISNKLMADEGIKKTKMRFSN
jgi:hypothetical protein